MELLTTIKQPIEDDIQMFDRMFREALTTSDPLLSTVLQHIKQRVGKRMRPILVLLIAKAFGTVSIVTQLSALGLELLHTASLVHDDVVDEADTRRHQASVNAIYDNRVSVLVGDFILATALDKISQTNDPRLIQALSHLGQTLAQGELLQLSILDKVEFSEDNYFAVIRQKTAAMFATCALLGAQSVNAGSRIAEEAYLFGQNLGIAFQIKDDIFDYYPQTNIGKPTSNDMEEGKLTLPAIYAINSTNDAHYINIAHRIRQRIATKEEINALRLFTISHGGIEYTQSVCQQYVSKSLHFIHQYVHNPPLRDALIAYVNYSVSRSE